MCHKRNQERDKKFSEIKQNQSIPNLRHTTKVVQRTFIVVSAYNSGIEQFQINNQVINIKVLVLQQN